MWLLVIGFTLPVQRVLQSGVASCYRIHFAGTESATVWCGFLNGAVQAGYRAANEVGL